MYYVVFVLHTYGTAKTVLARERTEKATDIIKKRNFHHIKKRISVVQYRFNIFDIGTSKKVIKVWKTQIIMDFETIGIFCLCVRVWLFRYFHESLMSNENIVLLGSNLLVTFTT